MDACHSIWLPPIRPTAARVVVGLVLGWAVWLAGPTSAAARSVIVLVAESAVPEGASGLRAAAIEAIAERGVTLVPTPDSEVCEADACAEALARQSGADQTLLLRVASPSEVELRAVGPDGNVLRLTQAVENADFYSAVGAVVERYFEHAPPGVLGFVAVRTTPPGARVRIDGVSAGTSPLRQSVAVGAHEVAVDGVGITASREIDVHPNAETLVEFVPDDSDAPETGANEAAPQPTRSEPSPFNWVLGGGLAVAGIVTLISPLTTFAQDGQCVQEIENVGCVERVTVGPQTGVLLSIGIAALVAAVIVDATAPIRVDVAITDQGATATLGGRF